NRGSNEYGSCSRVSMTMVAGPWLKRDKRVPGLLPELARCPVVHDAAVEVDVLVVALGFLGDLELDVEQLAQISGKFRQLLQVQTADMEVGLHELQRVRRKDAVAPHEAVNVARRQNAERPL